MLRLPLDEPPVLELNVLPSACEPNGPFAGMGASDPPQPGFLDCIFTGDVHACMSTNELRLRSTTIYDIYNSKSIRGQKLL